MLNHHPEGCRCSPGQANLTTQSNLGPVVICLTCYRETVKLPEQRHSERCLPESHRRGTYAATKATMTDLSPALHHVATRTSETDRLRVRISDLREVRDIQADVDAVHQAEKDDDGNGFWVCFGALLALFLSVGGIIALALYLALP